MQQSLFPYRNVFERARVVLKGLGRSIKASFQAYVSHNPNMKRRKWRILHFMEFEAIFCQPFNTYNGKLLCASHPLSRYIHPLFKSIDDVLPLIFQQQSWFSTILALSFFVSNFWLQDVYSSALQSTDNGTFYILNHINHAKTRQCAYLESASLTLVGTTSDYCQGSFAGRNNVLKHYIFIV